MWTGGVYLLLLTQLLENKAVIDLTEANYVEAQKVCNSQKVYCSARTLFEVWLWFELAWLGSVWIEFPRQASISLTSF